MLDHRLLVNPPGGGVVVVEGEVVAVVKGSNLVEQRTEADEVAGDLTFSAPVAFVEIVNLDTENAGTFTVNGVALLVPPEVIVGPIGVGATPAAVVEVTGSTEYIVSRYA